MAITQKSLERLWLKAMMAVLFGYSLLGKEFAYFFLGEMLLVIGVLIFIRSQRLTVIFSDSTLLIWSFFALWGVLRTLPFLRQYGFYAIRDAALWGYGLVAVLIVAFVNNSNQISKALNSYRRIMAWLVPVLFLMLAVEFTAGVRLPAPPWAPQSSFPLIKGGDAAVNLAGGALLMFIFASSKRASGRQEIGVFRVLGWIGLVGSAFILLIAVRAGFAAIIVPITLVALMRFQKVGWKLAAVGLFAVVLVFGVLEADLATFTIRGRQFNSDQMAASVTSVFSNTEHTELEGSKEWRLGWWKNIIDYTVFGRYFWTGKGFGVNLAVEDGPPGLTAEETALRSPHNGNMTVLARMGVPGALLWIAMNASFAFRLLAAYRRSNRQGLRFWAGVNLWVLLFWLAALINLSFDVYLEGPVGGMWFWATIGFGVAALRVQAYEARKVRAQQQFQVAV